jgi:hypothetical protein
MIISNNIKSDNIKSDGFIIVPLKDMFTKSTTDKVIEKDGKKYTLKVANLNLSFVETAGYYTCLEYSNIKLKKDQELKLMISEPKMDQIPFRQYDIKIWKESEIEDFSSPNTSGKGLNSKVPQEACDSFLNQFLPHHNLIQIYYKGKHIMRVINSDNDEEEVGIHLKLNKRQTKKGQTNSSPFCVEFLISTGNGSNRDVQVSSKIASALNEMKDWKNLHFDGEKDSCFPSDLETIDRFDDFYVYLTNGEAHSLREIIPWPFRMGFLVNKKTGTIYANKIEKTQEEILIECYNKKRKSKTIKNKNLNNQTGTRKPRKKKETEEDLKEQQEFLEDHIRSINDKLGTKKRKQKKQEITMEENESNKENSGEEEQLQNNIEIKKKLKKKLLKKTRDSLEDSDQEATITTTSTQNHLTNFESSSSDSD